MVGMGWCLPHSAAWLARHLQSGQSGHRAAGRAAARAGGLFQAFDAANITYIGALRGAGDTRWMMWMTLIIAYGFGLPLSCFLGFEWAWRPTARGWRDVVHRRAQRHAHKPLENGHWRRISIFSETRLPGKAVMQDPVLLECPRAGHVLARRSKMVTAPNTAPGDCDMNVIADLCIIPLNAGTSLSPMWRPARGC